MAHNCEDILRTAYLHLSQERDHLPPNYYVCHPTENHSGANLRVSGFCSPTTQQCNNELQMGNELCMLTQQIRCRMGRHCTQQLRNTHIGWDKPPFLATLCCCPATRRGHFKHVFTYTYSILIMAYIIIIIIVCRSLFLRSWNGRSVKFVPSHPPARKIRIRAICLHSPIRFRYVVLQLA